MKIAENNQLNLVNTLQATQEKRILPQFPFCTMVFKTRKTKKGQLTFFVHDISHTGMQIHLKTGEHNHQKGKNISGKIHWKGHELTIKGKVEWIKNSALGLSFEMTDPFTRKLFDFLSLERVASFLRPLHLMNWDFEIPPNLKYWLHTDGPVEIFVWRYNDGEYAKFQCILFEHFVEWEDGQGVRTGKLLTHRDLSTPLYDEDEFAISLDPSPNKYRSLHVRKLIGFIDSKIFPDAGKDFLLRKI